MIWIKLAILLLCAYLNWQGGYNTLWCRRFLMPFILAVSCGFFSQWWWAIPAIFIPMAITLSLHNQNRGVWCSIVALSASFALLVTGHLAWYWFIVYCGGNFLIGWVGNNKLKLPQVIIDPLTGGAIGSLVFFV